MESCAGARSIPLASGNNTTLGTVVDNNVSLSFKRLAVGVGSRVRAHGVRRADDLGKVLDTGVGARVLGSIRIGKDILSVLSTAPYVEVVPNLREDARLGAAKGDIVVVGDGVADRGEDVGLVELDVPARNDAGVSESRICVESRVKVDGTRKVLNHGGGSGVVFFSVALGSKS